MLSRCRPVTVTFLFNLIEMCGRLSSKTKRSRILGYLSLQAFPGCLQTLSLDTRGGFVEATVIVDRKVTSIEELEAEHERLRVKLAAISDAAPSGPPAPPRGTSPLVRTFHSAAFEVRYRDFLEWNDQKIPDLL